MHRIKLSIKVLALITYAQLCVGMNFPQDQCFDFGKLDKQDEFYQYRDETGVLKWDRNLALHTTRRVTVLSKIMVQLEEIDSIREKILTDEIYPQVRRQNGSYIGVLQQGETRYERHNRVLQLSSTTGREAYDACLLAGGRFPTADNIQDKEDLKLLAENYGQQQLLIEADLFGNVGPRSPNNGFVIIEWNINVVQPAIDYFLKNEYRPMIQIMYAEKPWIRTVWDSENEGAIAPDMSFNSLCLVPRPNFQASLDNLDSIRVASQRLASLINHLEQRLLPKHEFFNRLGEPGITTAPSNVEVISAGIPIIGLEKYESTLQLMADPKYYHDPSRDHLSEMNNVITWITQSLENESHDSEWMSLIPSDELKSKLGRIVAQGKGNIGNDYKSQLISSIGVMNREVLIRIENSFHGYITNATIRFIGIDIPTSIYKIKKYITPLGEVLRDSYLVDDPENPFSSETEPIAQNCFKIASWKTCSYPGVDHSVDRSGGRSYDCGESMTRHGSDKGCPHEGFKHAKPIIMQHQICTEQNQDFQFYDIINANFKGKVIRKCIGEIDKEYNFTIGYIKIPTSFGKICNYEYDGESIHGMNDLKSDEKVHDTIFGQYTDKELRILVLSVVGITLSLLICIWATCMTRLRISCRKTLCCYCEEHGWEDWKKDNERRIRGCRMCCTGESQPSIVQVGQLNKVSKREGKYPGITWDDTGTGVANIEEIEPDHHALIHYS